jgi:hypothetical protein
MGSVPSMNKKFAIMQKKRALLFYKNLSGYGIILYILYSSFNDDDESRPAAPFQDDQ